MQVEELLGFLRALDAYEGSTLVPPPFTRDVREEKEARAYAHVYDHYFGSGQSVYEANLG